MGAKPRIYIQLKHNDSLERDMCSVTRFALHSTNALNSGVGRGAEHGD